VESCAPTPRLERVAFLIFRFFFIAIVSLLADDEYDNEKYKCATRSCAKHSIRQTEPHHVSCPYTLKWLVPTTACTEDWPAGLFFIDPF